MTAAHVACPSGDPQASLTATILGGAAELVRKQAAHALHLDR